MTGGKFSASRKTRRRRPLVPPRGSRRVEAARKEEQVDERSPSAAVAKALVAAGDVTDPPTSLVRTTTAVKFKSDSEPWVEPHFLGGASCCACPASSCQWPAERNELRP